MYSDVDNIKDFVSAWEIPGHIGTLQRSSNFLQELVSSEGLLDEPVGSYAARHHVSLAQFTDHKDSERGVNHEAMLQKPVNGH